MSASTPRGDILGLAELFPALSSHEIDLRLIRLLEFCHLQQLPYPVEPKGAYAVWWRALHEIGHWAVKPRWYINSAASLFPSLTSYEGDVRISVGSVAGLDHDVDLKGFRWYRAGNDVIPDLGMWHDPTPGEPETRLWSLTMLEVKGWPHPFEENVGGVETGDYLFHKPSSARVWAPLALNDQLVCENFALWGLNPQAGQYRSWEAPNNASFVLPHAHPRTHDELWENYLAIYRLCDAKESIPMGRAFFDWYHVGRWPESKLREIADRERRECS